jgi:hypothetical protein
MTGGVMNKMCIEELKKFLKETYQLDAISVEEAKRGYYGETWKVETNSDVCFVKIVYSKSHKEKYESSFGVMDYLNSTGINFISKIIKTYDGKLFSKYNSGILGVFSWIDGENVEDDNAKIAEIKMLSKIYSVSRSGLNIPVEDFGIEIVEQFYSQWKQLKGLNQNSSAIKIVELFNEKEEILKKRKEIVLKMAEICEKDKCNYYITHGDAGGNVMKNNKKYYLVDWDDPVYAPPERDMWFYLDNIKFINKCNEEFKKHGLDYKLNRERLIYYCYKSFFWYLTLYLKTYFENYKNNISIIKELKDYFNGWIDKKIAFIEN